MRWINALERRFGHLAFPGLIRIVAFLNLLVYLLLIAKPAFIGQLEMDSTRVRAGEVWRVVSYIFIPQVTPGSSLSLLWFFLYLNFLWLVGEGLEQAWGSFRVNLFYLIGVLGTTTAALCFQFPDATGVFLNMSLLFAFATLFPNYPILIFFIIPVAVRWIALVTFVFLLPPLLGGPDNARLAIIVALSNYLVFFAPMWWQRWRDAGKIAKRQQQFQLAQHIDDDETLHRCKQCGRTEVSSPDLEFRVAGDGEEYCREHLPARSPEGASPG